MKQTNKGTGNVRQHQGPAESVEERAWAEGNSVESPGPAAQHAESTSSGLVRIREAAKRDRDLRFTSLLHHLSVDLLDQAFHSLKRHVASGVDGVTWAGYRENLSERLTDLHRRVQSGGYRALPSKRSWVPKPDGRQRPIGILALEDKIVQQALVWVLQSIYEVDFAGFSYGFRPGRSQHDALDALYVALTQRKVSWVLDADLKSFFDTLSHEWLIKFLEHRVADRRIVRLVRKFLRAGVSEDGQWSKAVAGTPQGAVLSPLLANLYLHHVLDLWVNWWRSNEASGDVYIVRYADDFVMCFQYERDARHCLAALRERLASFSLGLNEDKTRLIRFGRFASDDCRKRREGKPQTFDFLGFTHMCSRWKTGRYAVRRHTNAKRLRSKLKEVRAELMRRRHQSMTEIGRWLRSVAQGHLNYYAVPTNGAALAAFCTQIKRAWLHALRRRSQKGRKLTWTQAGPFFDRWLPRPRILHPFPDQRFGV